MLHRILLAFAIGTLPVTLLAQSVTSVAWNDPQDHLYRNLVSTNAKHPWRSAAPLPSRTQKGQRRS